MREDTGSLLNVLLELGTYNTLYETNLQSEA